MSKGKCLITGASSGIGREFAVYLSSLGYDIIAAARSEEKLSDLKSRLKTDVTVIASDLSKQENCYALYEKVKDSGIDIVINNAGFGFCGYFEQGENDADMINVNVAAVGILTKLFYKDFAKRKRGYILNVASIAAFMPGPLMAQYYATKAYVLRLTQAVAKEAKMQKNGVHLSVLCPGPVDTNFNKTAHVKFALKGISAQYAARYAVQKMFKGKTVILPTLKIKAIAFASRICPDRLLVEIASRVQKSKII